MSVSAVILAAGKGTRMKSSIVKVAHQICDKPIINYVLDAAQAIGVANTYIVVGHQADRIKAITADYNATYAAQSDQLGTGHAVMQVIDQLKQDSNEDVVILAGDCPLISPETLHALIAQHRDKRAAISVLTTEMAAPGAYGRIIRETSGQLLGIREAKDCTPQQLAINEVNTGVYCINKVALLSALDRIDNQNNQNEYYLTDVVGILHQDGAILGDYCTPNSDEAIGVNTRQQLAEITKIVYRQVADHWMNNGVSFDDPETAFIDKSVTIGQDVHIGPFTCLKGATAVGDGVSIGAYSYLENASVASGESVPARAHLIGQRECVQ